ncbi:MAG: type II secretion system protein [Patescibacteria group bacterium]
MMHQFLVASFQFLAGQVRDFVFVLKTQNSKLKTTSGFTLIETLVAISLLAIAIVAPMSLTSQSLTAAYYARDQVTAFNLAQEGLEAVRAFRDGQVLLISQSASAAGINLFGVEGAGIPVNQDFIIDSRVTDLAQSMDTCGEAGCPYLQVDGSATLYGYDPQWTPTYFKRILRACYIQPTPAYTCNSTPSDEMRVTVTVTWPTASQQTRSFTIYDDLYRWVNDGSAAQ